MQGIILKKYRKKMEGIGWAMPRNEQANSHANAEFSSV